jgi:hypothetical protein
MMEEHCGLQFAVPDDVTARWPGRGIGGHVLSSITRLATWLMFLNQDRDQTMSKDLRCHQSSRDLKSFFFSSPSLAYGAFIHST